MAATPGAAQEWWKTGIVYQVYPSSFMDAGSDGTNWTCGGWSCGPPSQCQPG